MKPPRGVAGRNVPRRPQLRRPHGLSLGGPVRIGLSLEVGVLSVHALSGAGAQ